MGVGGVREVACGSFLESRVEILFLFLVWRGQSLGETLSEIREDLLSLKLLWGGLD